MDTSAAHVATRTDGRTAKPSTANRVGYVIAGLLAVTDVLSVTQPTPDGQPGPPFGILIAGAIFGVITFVGVWFGWARRSRIGTRAAAVSRVLSMLLAFPAFFVDGIPPFLVALVAVLTLLTITGVVLMLLPPKPVTEGQ